MPTYLILKLDGVLQSWGGHTFEDTRPSELFPTRSGLLGLLAACLGIHRDDARGQRLLGESVLFTVRIDQNPVRMTDYHTIQNARKSYSGLAANATIQTWRDYLQDARYTVAIAATTQATIALQQLKGAVTKPVFTPYLGRRCCPLSRPLFAAQLDAANVLAALGRQEPQGGRIYSEEPLDGARRLSIRDDPIPAHKRQFATRTLYMRAGGKDDHVSE